MTDFSTWQSLSSITIFY